MEERRLNLTTVSQTRPIFKFKKDRNVLITPINTWPVEHVVKEIEVDESSPSPSAEVHEEAIQGLSEVVPEIILNEEPYTLSPSNVETPSKWSHMDTVTFLEVLNRVLDSQEAAGGFLSRKNLFTKVTSILNDQGMNFTCSETEKKYNNMLMTFRRCQQRLIKKRQTPAWPYFKIMAEIGIKLEEMQVSMSDGHLKRLTESRSCERSWLKRKSWFDSLFLSYPFVSALPEESKVSIPGCLTRQCQRSRAHLEEKKVSLVQSLIADWGCQREIEREKRKKLRDILTKENNEWNCLRIELNRGRIHCGKEVRYLAQDVACLNSAVKSIRATK